MQDVNQTISSDHGDVKPCLEVVLNSLGLLDRHWEALEARVGFDQLLTLEETGWRMGHISRERVRQIQREAIQRINGRFRRLRPALEALEAHAHNLWTPFDEAVTADNAIYVCRRAFTNAGWEAPSQREVKRLLIILRALVPTGAHRREGQFARIWLATCALPPVIEAHEGVAEELARLQIEAKSWSYKQLAVAVLKEAN
jgi:hypothetical protein